MIMIHYRPYLHDDSQLFHLHMYLAMVRSCCSRISEGPLYSLACVSYCSDRGCNTSCNVKQNKKIYEEATIMLLQNH